MNAVNLIPKDRRRSGQSTGTGLPFVGLMLGLAIVLAASALYVIGHSRVDSRRAQLAVAQTNVTRWSAAAASYASDVAAAKQRSSVIGSVEGLVDQRTDWSELLGQLAAAMPSDSALSSLTTTAAVSSSASSTGSSATSPAAGAPVSGSAGASSIEVNGCAASQSAVAQTMIRLRRITGISSVDLGSSSYTPPAGSSHGSGSSSGGCGYPVTFTMSLAFDPPTTMPSTATTPTAVQSTADTSSDHDSSGVS